MTLVIGAGIIMYFLFAQIHVVNLLGKYSISGRRRRRRRDSNI